MRSGLKQNFLKNLNQMRRTHRCFSLKEFLKEVTKVRYCVVHVVSKNRTLYPHLLIRMPQRLFMHMIILIGSSKPTYLQLQPTKLLHTSL